MKDKTWKKIAIGLFVVAMLMNVSVYFDSSGSSTSDLTLGNMKVNLFQKAYACGGDDGGGDSDTPCLDEKCYGGTQLCATITKIEGNTTTTIYCYGSHL